MINHSIKNKILQKDIGQYMHSDQICQDYYIDVRENRRDLLHRRSRKSKGSIV